MFFKTLYFVWNFAGIKGGPLLVVNAEMYKAQFAQKLLSNQAGLCSLKG